MLDRLKWQPLAKDETVRLAREALNDGQSELLPKISIEGRIADLPFYTQFKLAWIRLTAPDGTGTSDLLMLVGKERIFVLDGTSAPIYKANEIDSIALTADNAGDYVRFFCFFVYGDIGPFLIVEELPPACRNEQADSPKCLELKEHIQPLVAQEQDDEGNFRFTGTVFYYDTLFRSVLEVAPGGTIEMLDDQPLVGDVPKDLMPTLPALFPASAHLVFGVAPKSVTAADIANLRTPLSALVSGPILEILVTLLLEQALIAQSGHRLIVLFNARVANRTPLQQFAELLANASPVVAIESAIPFVEEIIANIVAGQRKGEPSIKIDRSEAEAADDTRLRVSVPNRGPALVLIPMHAYRGITDVMRVSHEIGSRNIAALIGCDRLTDLPDCLREIVDVTLRLPPMTPAMFEALFQAVMGMSLPEGWQQPDAHWVSHVTHTDLEHPSGFKLSPEEAVKFIRERVLERLRTVDPASGLSLKDLHGLGEARLFAEDLIADIHAAMAGQLPWSEVDRGVLLAGPPGTGKTTLARAIAKDCGIKFITASAAGWQAVGHLGDHIRAIRADFTQARRFAPAILFIDEIDSIGNREQLSGQNMQYQAEVVNAVLEQIQGLDPTAPVMVIGATNHPERVDPALRRAGRLDRTIEIPYPNSAALASIFDHYLKPFVDKGELAADVDSKLLGQMSFGCTGADIEFFVRGARRRARKVGRLLGQEDLLAEITGKPRDPNSAPRLTPEEVERVAAHEAGHAIARCQSSTKGKDITFVSIVPRTDGTLGFVASAPPERNAYTRADYIEYLEIVLAGRAAEEVRYGEKGISSGAQDDLRKATQTAQLMASRYGLGPDGSLVWTDSPTSAHMAQAEKLLGETYSAIRAKLIKNRERLLTLAEALKQRQEMTGAEVITAIK